MAVKRQDWGLSQRGLKDAARHREKVRESIQKNIADIIADASIITRKKGQIVRVPIRGLKSYRFIFRRESSGGTGVGQGKGEKGEVIGRQPSPGGQPGQAGDQPGVDYLETEIDVEQLIDMMFEDLGLPNLKKKPFTETATPKGWKFNSIEKTGILAQLDKKRTLKEAVRRTASFVGDLARETGQPEGACRKALAMAGGNLSLAKKFLQEGVPLDQAKDFIPLFSEDLRYRTLEKDLEYHSNAVVIAMMDVSGSMGTMKKYLARSFFFWLVEFLKQLYKRVEIRFIAHATEATLVDEHEFFHKGESGGTFCHAAYDLASYLVETEYSPSRWNVYPFHFSDGEDFEPLKTMASAKRLMQQGINLLGYGEIHTDPYTTSRLMDTFARELHLDRGQPYRDDFEIFLGTDRTTPFIGAILRDKSHVYLALKEFLRKERGFDQRL
jgi:sporulation protein YhbH